MVRGAKSRLDMILLEMIIMNLLRIPILWLLAWMEAMEHMSRVSMPNPQILNGFLICLGIIGMNEKSGEGFGLQGVAPEATIGMACPLRVKTTSMSLFCSSDYQC